MAVPFLDLQRQHSALGGEIEAAISEVIASGRYILGPEVANFETDFAAFCGTRFAVGVASGTDALTIALLASGAIAPGRAGEVITSALSASFTGLAILRAGGVPVFVDVEDDTMNIDPEAVRAAINERTRAIIPVHLNGLPARMEPLCRLAEEHGLVLVEDACQAHGAGVDGSRVGSFGQAAAFSLYPTKNLSAIGDGGAITTSDDELYRRALFLRNGSQQARQSYSPLAFNSRLDEMQAAILRVKLKYLDAWNERRRQLAAQYRQRLEGLVRLPCEDPGHVYHLFVVRHPQRDRLQKFLADHGVESIAHYPAPLNRQPAFATSPTYGYRMPSAERIAAEALSLPLYPEMRLDELHEVASLIARFVKGT